MNPCLSKKTTLRRASLLLCASAVVGLSACGEVTPVPPTSVSNLPPGAVAPVAPAVKAPTTSSTLPRPKAIDAPTKTAATLSPAQTQVIDSYIKTSFTRLMSDDASAIELARADLIVAVASPGGSPCSAPYLTQYLSTFTPQMQAIVGKGPLSKRVNAAIVLARVIENINSANAGGVVPLSSLHPLILLELNDKCDAVALWGMKAASQAMVASPAALPQNILSAIVPSVKAHGMSGPVTEEAYDALNRPTPAAIAGTIELYKLRLAAYTDSATPPDPSVDRRAASHLTANAMWSVLSPAQQSQVMDMIRQNLNSATIAIVAPGATDDLVRELRMLCSGNGKAVQVQTNSAALSILHIDAKNLGEMSDTTPAPEVVTKATRVITGLQQAFPVGNAAGGAAPAAGNLAGANATVAK